MKKIKFNEAFIQDVLRYGVYLRTDNFETRSGIYTVRVVKYEGRIFYHMMKNGLTECFMELK